MTKLTSCLALLLIPFAILSPGVTAPAETLELELGKRIYEEGTLVSGRPLVGKLPVGVTLIGGDAACAKCHRISGSGGFEGGTLIPPITGPDLFDARPEHKASGSSPSSIQREEFHFLSRPPYSLESLAANLRTGLAPGGDRLSDLMPRYDLSKRDLAALSSYLWALSREHSVGYDGRTLDLATVITPDVGIIDREGLIQTLEACFNERYPEDRPQGMRWRLSVWQLEGNPDGWEAQLAKYQSRRPVFAVVSGAGVAEWSPVHRYCERERLPCLFPSVDVPGDRNPSRYSFYFSAGTLLEADVMAYWLMQGKEAKKPRRIVQIVSLRNPAGQFGASALTTKALAADVTVETRTIEDQAQLLAATSDLRDQDAVALWLPRQLLDTLPGAATLPPDLRIVASGWLGDAAHVDVASPWREKIAFVYPFDPPARLERRMDFNLRPWVSAHGIPPAREMVLGNALTSCLLLTEAISAQHGALTREKLIEQIENYPSGMGNAPAPQVFHEFSLGPGQRFSSKGAYIVKLADKAGHRLQPIGDWVIP